MTATLEDLRQMLEADGYALAVESSDSATHARVTAGEGICGDCLVPKVVMQGMLAAALSVEPSTITIDYPEEH